MATNEKLIAAPVENVFAVLADPASYGHWVVGTSRVETYDSDWPREGATFEHTQGQWPLTISDSATVLEAEPDRRILLEVRTRPLVVAKVELELREEKGGTRVRMVERPVGGLVKLLYNPLLDAVTHLRNAVALDRLARLAEGVR